MTHQEVAGEIPNGESRPLRIFERDTASGVEVFTLLSSGREVTLFGLNKTAADAGYPLTLMSVCDEPGNPFAGSGAVVVGMTISGEQAFS